MEVETVDVVLGVEEEEVNGIYWMVLEVRLDEDEDCATRELLVDGSEYGTETVEGVLLCAGAEGYWTYDGADETVLLEDVKVLGTTEEAVLFDTDPYTTGVTLLGFDDVEVDE